MFLQGQSNNNPSHKHKNEQNNYDSYYKNQNRQNHRMLAPNRYRPMPYNNSQRRSLPSTFHQNLNKGTKFQVVNTPPEIKRKCQDISNLELRANANQTQRSQDDQEQHVNRQQQIQQRLQQEQQRQHQLELQQKLELHNERKTQESNQEQESQDSPKETESEHNSVGEPNEDGIISKLKAEPEEYGDEIPLKEDGYSPDDTFDDGLDDQQAGTSMDVKIDGQEHVSQGKRFLG